MQNFFWLFLALRLRVSRVVMSKPTFSYEALQESRRALADSEDVLAQSLATSPPLEYIVDLHNTRYRPLPPMGSALDVEPALFERPPLPPRDLADSWYSGVPQQRYDARGYPSPNGSPSRAYQSPSGSPSSKEAHKSFLPHQLPKETVETKETKKTGAAPAAPPDAASQRPPPVAVPHTPLEITSEAEARAAEASAAAASAAASALVKEAAAVASAAGAAAAGLRALSESGVKQVAAQPQTPARIPAQSPAAAAAAAGSAACTPATPRIAIREGRAESPAATVTRRQCEASAAAAAAVGAEGAGHLSDSRSGPRCRRSAEAEHVEKARQLAALLHHWPSFGLCAIAATHPVPDTADGSSWLDAMLLKAAPLLVVAAQLAGLPMMLVASVADGAQACDATVHAATRGLVATVALLYLARSLTVLRARWAEHAGAARASLGASEAARYALRRREASGLALSPLAELCGVDGALHATYEGVARLLGLWLVSHASGAGSLLGYAVAVEVLLRLGEACKAWYLEARGDVVAELLAWQLDATPMMLLGRDGQLGVHPYWRRPATAASAPSYVHRAKDEGSAHEGAPPAKLGTLSQLLRLARALARLAKLRWLGSQRSAQQEGGSQYGELDAEGGLIVDVHTWRRRRIGRGVDALMSTANRLSWPLRSFGPGAVAIVLPFASVVVFLVGPAGPSC